MRRYGTCLGSVPRPFSPLKPPYIIRLLPYEGSLSRYAEQIADVAMAA